MKKYILLFLLVSFFANAQCWQKISISATHCLAIKADGTLWAWGDNGYGQLGNGTSFSSSTPIQIGTDNDWWQISAGSGISMALKNNGTLWSWGRNNYGQLGDGTFINHNSPIQVGSETNWTNITNTQGGYHFAAIKSNGTLWCWGFNDQGQLGDGTLVNKNVPTQVGIATDWSMVSTGGFFTHAIKTNGSLWGWGDNTFGQIGDSSTSDRLNPVQIGTATDWTNVVGGSYYTAAIKNNQTIWQWGYNNYGQLGLGNNINKSIPTQVGTATDWQKIFAGGGHTLGMKTNGTLWSWGYNNHGQLGDGTLVSKNAPIQIGTATDWQDIFANGFRSASFSTTNLDLYAWGLNAQVQLGDGTSIDRTTPVQIICTPLSNEQFIANDFMLYPNPATSVLNMVSDNHYIESAKVFNLIGEQIPVQNENDQLNVGHLSKGLYVLEITSEGKKFYKKFLKE